MKWNSGRNLISVLGTLGVLLVAPPGTAGNRKDFPEKYSAVYIPVSLAIGTARTPEFPVIQEGYDIVIQAERVLPVGKMMCMMGATTSPFESEECSSDDPLLRADWTVWNGVQIVAHGSSSHSGGRSIAEDHIWKSLGVFAGQVGQRYVVEVKFMKDGSSLNVANPRLIIIRHKKFW